MGKHFQKPGCAFKHTPLQNAYRRRSIATGAYCLNATGLGNRSRQSGASAGRSLTHHFSRRRGKRIKTMEADEDIMILREMLWRNHGHTGMYGDDGEMQCMQCLAEYGFFDWKRTPVKEINRSFSRARLRNEQPGACTACRQTPKGKENP